MTEAIIDEKSILNFWEKEKIYSFKYNSKKKIFSIDTPPPTVSGEMHLGHAFSYSQADFIARFKRMSGFNVFYPFGTDDNGLPTERLVEKKKNVKAKEMERQEFINLCMEFLKEELPKFIQDWKNMGISCDFSILYSTIDRHSQKISQWSFLDLYKRGRIYRKEAPAMWCPECMTGVAQVEVQDKEKEAWFNDIVFNCDEERIVISTTRPELLPACVAIFYHPSDKRYKKFLGKKAKVPLFNFEVPIMEDKRVNPEKGTGIVMCCTFGDQTDMEWQKAYNLPIKTAITENGKMSEISGKYSGMPIKKAREEIISDLKKEGLLIKQEKIKHFVNVHERCGTEIEFLKSKQWFVKYLDLKKQLLKWGSELKWYPKYMKHRYDNWVKGLQWDWLISNQRYFGVPFPVWYCKNCDEVILAEKSQLPVDPQKDKPKSKCKKCGSKEFIPEMDVLNTWFTSSMTPQIAITLIKNKKIQKKLFPMSLRPQAHDIITFWLFNTLLKSRLHFNKNPWKDVAISGFVKIEGEKMSKSKGNIVRPQEIMQKYGADTIRYWAAGSKLGEDFNYQEKDIITGKKFIIKIINAANFIFSQIKQKPKKPKKPEALDALFLNKINYLILSVTKSFENYDYARAKALLEDFFWHDFCDNYLEIIKWRIYNGNKNQKQSAAYTLYTSFFSLLKMFAPITPFVTEHLYQKHYKKNEKEKSIHLCSWPKYFKKRDFSELELFFELLKKVRQEKTLNKKPMNSECIIYLKKEDFRKIKKILEDFKHVNKAKEIKEGSFKVEFL
ncbi:MAG: valine--tRNA ligase [Candidatus Pacearchaeota archaeon]|nr:MAG: valine--tRNA ligase [Candidatus Pacearchaeota archaeon]